MFRKLAFFPFAILAVTLLVANRSVVPLGRSRRHRCHPVAASKLILMALVLIALGEASLIFLPSPDTSVPSGARLISPSTLLLTLPLDDSKERGRFIEKVRERLSISCGPVAPILGVGAAPTPRALTQRSGRRGAPYVRGRQALADRQYH
jgi:hypothetical protein